MILLKKIGFSIPLMFRITSTIYSFNNRGFSSMRKKCTHPTTAWYLLMLLITNYCGIASYSSLLHGCQYGGFGHSGMNSMCKMIPQVFGGVEVRTAGRPFIPLCSHILEVGTDYPHPLQSKFENRIWSQTVEIRDCNWLQNLILISICIKMNSNDDKPVSTRCTKGSEQESGAE